MLQLGPHVLHWSSREPSIALLRWGLDEITPQKICESTAPLKAALSVKLKKNRKSERARKEGKRIRGRQEREKGRVISGRDPRKEARKENNAKDRTQKAREV